MYYSEIASWVFIGGLFSAVIDFDVIFMVYEIEKREKITTISKSDRNNKEF